MIKFIVDSTFGVSREYAKENDIKIVSLKIILDEQVSDEGFEESWGEFFERFKASDNFPSTSQPNSEAYKEAAAAIWAENPDASVVILTIANGLSGTINSARLAAESFGSDKIVAIDSQNACAASWLMMDELVQYAAANPAATLAEIEEFARDVISRTSIKFVPASMKYLKRGGRVGAVGALIASVISVKPIFEFKNNLIAVPAKVLGMSKAINEMISMLPQKIKRLFVCYIAEDEYIPMITRKVEEQLGVPYEVRAISPVFGVHVGIGAVGIACVEE